MKYYYDDKGHLHEEKTGKKKRLPLHVIRKLNHTKKGEPGFVCPECKERFVMSYGRFGKMKWNEESRYYCRDCSCTPRFTKTDR